MVCLDHGQEESIPSALGSLGFKVGLPPPEARSRAVSEGMLLETGFGNFSSGFLSVCGGGHVRVYFFFSFHVIDICSVRQHDPAVRPRAPFFPSLLGFLTTLSVLKLYLHRSKLFFFFWSGVSWSLVSPW